MPDRYQFTRRARTVFNRSMLRKGSRVSTHDAYIDHRAYIDDRFPDVKARLEGHP